MEEKKEAVWKFFIPFYGIYALYQSNRPKKIALYLVSGLISFIALGMILPNDKSSKNSIDSTGKGTAESEKPVVIGSPDQMVFHTKINELKRKYYKAPNDIKKSAVYRELAKFVVSHVKGGKFKDWQGKIDTIGTNEGGTKAYLTIEADWQDIDIEYKTWNNELSDLRSRSMISLKSSVYKQLAELQQGDEVIFSGRFIRDSKRGFEQANMLESSVVTDPEFIIRFSEIKKKN